MLSQHWIKNFYFYERQYLMNGSRISNEKRHLTRLFALNRSKTDSLNNLKVKNKKIITLLLGVFILRLKKSKLLKNLQFVY